MIMGLVKDYLDILKDRGIYKIGIHKSYYNKKVREVGLDADVFGDMLFKNYGESDYLLMKESIISMKTLRQALREGKVLDEDSDVPPVIKDLYRKSVPKFKTQAHFYGYDGRGSDPSSFDCSYTYNLGLTVFSLIANGATGQMAAIKNLELDFSNWEPIGIPIAPLMRLEERKGKLTLVLEKSIVDTDSTAFRVVKALRKEWLAATPGEDNYRNPGPIRFTGESEEERPITLVLNAIDGE